MFYASILSKQKDYDSAYNDLLSAASTMTYTLVQNVLHADKPWKISVY